MAVSPDDRFAFVTLEFSDSLAVFDLRKALASGFGPADFVGTVPLGTAPVGLAVSPDGRWIYATSESGRDAAAAQAAEQLATGQTAGTVTAIDLRQAETRPADAVDGTVPAGCSPVRVVTSADGKVVWVTARGSDAVLGFSATALRADPRHAPLAQVQVGEAPAHEHAARHRLSGRAGPGGQPGHGALMGPSSSASGPGSRPCCTANIAAAVLLEAPILA